MFTNILSTALLLALAAASPLRIVPRQAPTAESILLSIAPSSNTCAGAPFPSECATASQAAPYLITAMQTYNIYSAPEIAAILSLIAFETGEFKYNINHYPGRPGQGTRNMQMLTYNLKYANSVPELQPKVTAITGGAAASVLSDTQMNEVLALVTPDQYTWASAAWFVATQCSDSVRSAMQAGGLAGFSAYMTCVGATPTSDRVAYWNKAAAAFGVPSS